MKNGLKIYRKDHFNVIPRSYLNVTRTEILHYKIIFAVIILDIKQ